MTVSKLSLSNKKIVKLINEKNILLNIGKYYLFSFNKLCNLDNNSKLFLKYISNSLT